jgi:tRNA-binding EMAP/Myf-like protein
MSGLWECAECAQENEASDETCIACEEPRPSQDADGDSNDKYSGYKVAQILTVEDVPGKLKLRVVQLDLGGGADKAIKVCERKTFVPLPDEVRRLRSLSCVRIWR